MINEVYAIFDAKALVYTPPFLFPNRAVAIRNFLTTAGDKQSKVGLYPDDFHLCFLGLFDDSSGQFTNEEKVLDLGSGKDFLGSMPGPDPVPSMIGGGGK